MATTALMCSATTVMDVVTSSWTAQQEFPHQEHLITMIDCAPSHTMVTTTETDHTLSTTDTAEDTTLTGQNHTINLNMTEASVTTRDIHPTLYPTTTAAFDTHPLTDSLGDTPTGTPHTVTDATHPQPNSLHTRATLTATPQTAANLVQGTLLIPPTYCMHGRHQGNINRQQPPIDPSPRRRSLFRTYSWNLPQNWMTIQML